MSQHKKPCRDCPWRRVSMPGWLANLPPEQWIVLAHSDVLEPCHLREQFQCAGLSIFRRHICKSPRSPEALRLPADKVKVFSNDQEFVDHHWKLGHVSSEACDEK